MGFLLQKKRRIGIALLALAGSFGLRIFQMLPRFNGPSAGGIDLKIFLPRFNCQVPCLCLLISDGQIKQRAGAIVFVQVGFAQDFAQQVERALQVRMFGPAVAFKVAGSSK